MYRLSKVKKNNGDRKATLANYFSLFDIGLLSSSVAFINLLPFGFLKENILVCNIAFILPLFILLALKNKYSHQRQISDYLLNKRSSEIEKLIILRGNNVN